MESTWKAVDEYVATRLLGEDRGLIEAKRRAGAAGLPSIAVSGLQGKQLYLLARSIGAKRILEVGTLGGYSAICMARALPEDGRLITIELDPRHARVATESVAAAGLNGRVEVRVGRALDLLPEVEGPFDLTFIDADKSNNPAYFEHAVRLSRPGGVIVVDNVVRNRTILSDSPDSSAEGARRLFEAVQRDARVEATVVQTVGEKGYDGYLMAWVLAGL